MLIKVKVKPSARKSEIIKINDQVFYVSVKSKPIRGQANYQVKKLLAQYFKLELEKIKLIKGLKQRHKIFLIP